ncbi:thiosulfate sulfurtransferase/rhodanese-like domain-containing protein 3 [Archocentrus centrarchus]|uniref:thiosulfate sulfurtransferase/rhodanese-like domain-containing protein 3 n=1 Tax=Archocentrus centrarchus TaxID=63155 RepID=UPI0011EA0D43|nr:thiosulfate sulfurtransferase/rhodanese-like domain-containing protein 3 [Archocentrus centrarchus]
MALRRCWRLTGAVPRLLWNNTILCETCVPGGRGSVSGCVSTRPVYKNTELLFRTFSSTPASTDVSYERLKELLAGRKAVVIDVREPWELREYGFIPGSINIPLGQVNTALQLGPEEFNEKYGGELPQQTDNIVFTCLAGIRSKTALDTAVTLGYKDVQHYPGGWQGWVKNEQHK